jgi:hypothetical protein
VDAALTMHCTMHCSRPCLLKRKGPPETRIPRNFPPPASWRLPTRPRRRVTYLSCTRGSLSAASKDVNRNPNNYTGLNFSELHISSLCLACPQANGDTTLLGHLSRAFVACSAMCHPSILGAPLEFHSILSFSTLDNRCSNRGSRTQRHQGPQDFSDSVHTS